MTKMTTVLDASMISVLQTQLTNINVRVMQTPLTDIVYPSLIPVNTGYSEWQPTAAGLTWGAGVGEAKWINTKSKDVPLVETSVSGQQITFDTFGVGWETDLQEVGQAAYFGANIPDIKARIARRKSEEFVQNVAFSGDADKGWTGLINKAGIAPMPASTKAATGTQWVNNDGTLNATAGEIATDMINGILGPVTSTRSVQPIAADTVGLPSLAYRALASTFTDALNGGISYLEFIRRQVQGAVPGTNFQIVEIPELATAATTTIVGGGRAIFYRRSLDILELPMAFAFRFLNEYKDAPYGYMIPGLGRIGEVKVWEPRGFRYMDGVQSVPA